MDAESHAVPAVPMVNGGGRLGIGASLQQAREVSGKSLADIASALKLGERQVMALEAEQWSQLPGPTFVRGFVRNYARVLDLEAGPLLEQLDAVMERPASVLQVPEVSQARIQYVPVRRRGLGRGVWFAMVLGLVVLAVYLASTLDQWRVWVPGLGNDPEPPVVAAPEVQTPTTPNDPLLPPGQTAQQVLTPQAQEGGLLAPPALVQDSDPNAAKVSPQGGAPLPAVPQVAPASPAVSPAPTMPVVAPLSSAVPAVDTGGAKESPSKSNLTVLEFSTTRSTWVEVQDKDGKTIFAQRLPAGTRQTTAGKGPLYIVIGQAAAVKLMWRGAPVDLTPHTRGDIARLVLE